MPQQTYFRNRLPHITPLGGTFFITFRLGDSLPRSVIHNLCEEYEYKKKELPETGDPRYHQMTQDLRETIFGQYDYQLDTHLYGSCILRETKAASLLADRIAAFDGHLYDLLAYCIMPNHIHLLLCVKPLDPGKERFTPLPKIMKLIKGGSARLINQAMGKNGQLWCIDYFDRFIRSEEHLERTWHYIQQNPVKAGLVQKVEDWPWTRVKGLERVMIGD